MPDIKIPTELKEDGLCNMTVYLSLYQYYVQGHFYTECFSATIRGELTDFFSACVNRNHMLYKNMMVARNNFAYTGVQFVPQGIKQTLQETDPHQFL